MAIIEFPKKTYVDTALAAKLAITSKASQAEAEAGTDNTKYMTALATAQAIEALASTGSGGSEVVASQSEAQAGTDNTKMMTPLRTNNALVTERTATATLTNKTLTSPVINSPTGITKTNVGLANVDNTSDLAKPISTATQTALDLKATTSGLTAHTANVSNPHSVTKTQVGLSNVDNTADTAKPVSTATQTALDLKVPTSYLDTDTALTANSDTKIPTQKAVKAYIDGTVGSGMPDNPTLIGVVTQAGASVTTPTSLSTLAIDTTKRLSTKTITGNSTFTFFGSPATGQTFSLHIINGSADVTTITIPSSFSFNSQAVRTTVDIQAFGEEFLTWRKEASRYVIMGDPISVSDLTESASPSDTDLVEVLVAGTPKKVQLSNLPGSLEDDPTLVGVVTQAGASVTTPTVLSTLAIDTSKRLSTKTITGNSTFTFFGSPATGQTFSLHITSGSADVITITIPSSFSFNAQTARTTVNIQAFGEEVITWRKEASRYVMMGDPISISNLTESTSPNSTDLVEVLVSGVPKKVQIGNLPVTGGGGGSANLTVSTTAPSSPSHADEWIDTASGVRYTYFNDGTSSQWVEFGTGTTLDLATVANPSFDPVAGEVDDNDTVTLSTTTSGASIRYTVDGSTPTNTTGTLYSTPIVITDDVTIKAIAYKTGSISSSVVTQAYTVAESGGTAGWIYSYPTSEVDDGNETTYSDFTYGQRITASSNTIVSALSLRQYIVNTAGHFLKMAIYTTGGTLLGQGAHSIITTGSDIDVAVGLDTPVSVTSGTEYIVTWAYSSSAFGEVRRGATGGAANSSGTNFTDNYAAFPSPVTTTFTSKYRVGLLQMAPTGAYTTTIAPESTTTDVGLQKSYVSGTKIVLPAGTLSEMGVWVTALNTTSTVMKIALFDSSYNLVSGASGNTGSLGVFGEIDAWKSVTGLSATISAGTYYMLFSLSSNDDAVTARGITGSSGDGIFEFGLTDSTFPANLPSPGLSTTKLSVRAFITP